MRTEEDMEEMLQTEVNRIKSDISELYSLDRSRQDDVSSISERLAVVETNEKHQENIMAEVKTDIEKMKSELISVKDKVEKVDAKVDRVDTKVQSVDLKVDTLKKDLIQEIQKTKENKWQPKDWCIVIVALLSLIGTIATALLKS